MPAYWIAMLDVTDPDKYAGYPSLAAQAVEKYGGRMMAVGGVVEVLEGTPPRSRYAMIEFESAEQASKCYHSPEYQKAVGQRSGAADAEFFILNGA